MSRAARVEVPPPSKPGPKPIEADVEMVLPPYRWPTKGGRPHCLRCRRDIDVVWIRQRDGTMVKRGLGEPIQRGEMIIEMACHGQRWRDPNRVWSR